MILCIDAGNTNISFGVFNKEKLVCKFDIKTERRFTSFEVFVHVNTILEHFKIKPISIKQVKIATVVPEIEKTLYECFKEIFKIKNVRLISVEDIKIKINLYNPSEVGIDRIINVFSAFQIYGKKKDVLIIDFGTAVTFDVGLKTLEYEGGVIYPGINLSLEALKSGTSKLPKVSLKKPTNPIGRSTNEAINAGIYYGYSGMVNYVVSEIQGYYNKKFNIILTGGLSSILIDYFDFQFKVDENLNLFGIFKV